MARLRYNDFNAERLENVRKLLAHCAIDPSLAKNALAAFDTDSQQGTQIGRNTNRQRLSETNYENIRATLALNPAFADPDIRLPDIYARA